MLDTLRSGPPQALRVPFLPAMLALGALLAVGCSDSAGDATGADNGPPVSLSSCGDDLDCRGGQLCIERLCRTLCDGAGDECRAPLNRCDFDLGICVQCTTSGDCRDGDACMSGLCILSGCRSDSDCAHDEFCDPLDNVCVQRGCSADLDCRGGEVCRDGRCRPANAPSTVCTPSSRRCTEAGVLICEADGAREVLQRCSAAERCVDTDGPARCERSATGCVPGEVGCNRDGSRWLCDADAQRITVRCEAGTTCLGGACEAVVCTPGETRCEGNTLVLCDPQGQAEVSVRCDDTTGCSDEPFGCTCSAGTCQARECQPGSRRCDGRASQACSDDGLQWLSAESCRTGESCVAGLCVEDQCSPGTSRCAGGVEFFCTPSGWDTTNCGARGQVCEMRDGTATCVARTCTPGLRECTGGSGYRVCNSDGTAWVDASCAAGQVCSAGTCITRACEPGARRCNGNTVEVCASDASGWTTSTNCGAGAVCTAGQCEQETRECDDDVDCLAPTAYCDGERAIRWRDGRGRCTVGRCDFDATEERVNCAANDQTCVNGRCDALPASCDRDSDCGGNRPHCRPGGFFSSGECVQCTQDSHCSGGLRCIDDSCQQSSADCTSDAQCRTRSLALGATQETANRARCDGRIGCYTAGRCGPLDASGFGDIFGSTCVGSSRCGNMLLADACAGCNSSADCRDGEYCDSPIPFLGGFCYNASGQ